MPLHLHPYYQKQWGYREGQFPVAEDYFERCVSIPLYPGMTEADADYVIENLHDIAYRFRA
jgi:dTDP-4-amino-4,6-dideoxygalactose transaminase